MTFDEYYKQAWSDHATQTKKVAESLSSGLILIKNNEQIAQMAQLITHVLGEHLGDWDTALGILEDLGRLSCLEKNSDSEKSILRCMRALNFAAEQEVSLKDLDRSEQARVSVMTAALLAGKNSERASRFFMKTLEIASSLKKDDTANRAIAMASNNLAYALGEMKQRSPTDNELMIQAATASRKFWEIAGTWMQVERSEYGLAKAYLKINQSDKAFEHARLCLDICKKNNAEAVEFFYGYEALALAEQARLNKEPMAKALAKMEEYVKLVEPSSRQWCLEALAHFKK